MYSIDFIRCAVAYRDEGHTFTELKTVFKIPPETYYLWKEKLENGYTGEKVFRERKRKIDKDILKQAVKDNPDIYLYKLAKIFNCTEQAVFYALEKLKITRKKTLHLS
ncbi:MAG: IS630 transposase-related protein [Treponema sp.]|nr:IS630 transposase-related protein [Treponema sp.]MCL2272646.1 IS630 transposase-related protein [Treponema sp.]